MERLFRLIFAILVIMQVGIAVGTTVMLAAFIGLVWEQSPWRAVAAMVGLAVVILLLFRAWRRERPAIGVEGVHPGPSVSRIPVEGSVGGIYMLQFLVWALVVPRVGLLYLILIGGGVLLVPVVAYVNRSSRRRAGNVATGGLVAVICGLLIVSIGAARELPLAGLFGAAVLSGLVGGTVLLVRGRDRGHPTIAPYVK